MCLFNLIQNYTSRKRRKTHACLKASSAQNTWEPEDPQELISTQTKTRLNWVLICSGFILSIPEDRTWFWILENVCYLDLGARYFKIISFNEDHEKRWWRALVEGLVHPKTDGSVVYSSSCCSKPMNEHNESEWWPWTIKLQYYKWSPYDLTFSLIFSLLFDLEYSVDHFYSIFFHYELDFIIWKWAAWTVY